jgi:asparagine synthase (glutamine-hydrolysing)
MCGICGLTATTSTSPVEAMNARMRHRGPDDEGVHFDAAGGVALGARRLSVIDVEGGHQPLSNEDGTIWAVLNGEIYNHPALLDRLRAAGHDLGSRCDTEVLVHLYEDYGDAFVHALEGMFAFAVWDSRRRRLLLGRDRFGEKPLFYTALPSGIAVASEIKALLGHPAVTARPNAAVVEAYAAANYYEDGEETFFDKILRLPPAHALVIGGDGAVRRRWRYWTPDYTKVDPHFDEREAVERFRELLERSLRMRLRSDVPIGTSLSGGLDSTMLVCLLSRLRGETAMLSQKTFSGRFEDDPTLSEGPQIDLVTRHAGVEPFGVSPDSDRLIEESALLHWHQEEPFLSASIYLQWCVMRLAKEQQTTVLIDGQGADELLAGYQYYFRSWQLDRLDRGEPLTGLLDSLRFTRRLTRASSDFRESGRRFDARIAYSWRRLLLLWARRPDVHAHPYTDGVPPALPGLRLRRQLAEALQYNSLPALLRYADRNAMAFSRETRFPFLDYELTDWCIHLPDAALVSKGWQKYILRRAAEGLIPPEIQWRADKVGYAAPFDRWVRGPLRDWGRERLFNGPIRDVPGYDAAALRALWDQHQAGEADHSWPLWRWISLNEWFALVDDGVWRTKAA